VRTAHLAPKETKGTIPRRDVRSRRDIVVEKFEVRWSVVLIASRLGSGYIVGGPPAQRRVRVVCSLSV